MQLRPPLRERYLSFTAFQFRGCGLIINPCRALWHVKQTSPSL
jgi:hypothetical protein